MSGIQLNALSKVYDNGFEAVSEVYLDIPEGEFMVLVGPSGCGKTTLLRMIAGLEEVTSGTIYIGGRDVTDMRPGSRDIAMVFQNYALYPQMTVRENLGFALKVNRTPKREARARVDAVAQTLGLDKLMDSKPGALSGGQRQRVAMGRAMVREPNAFLMDEPLSNLDAKLRVDMRTELARLHARLAVTTVYVTHDQVEAMTLGHRVAVLKDGGLQQCDTPTTLFDHPANLFVAAFMGSPSMNLVEGTIVESEIRFADVRLPLSPLASVPAADRRVIVGLRPTDFEVVREHTDPSWPTIRAQVTLLEKLGTENYVVFAVDAPRVLVDAPVDVPAAGDIGESQLLVNDSRAMFTASVDPREQISIGETVELAIDTSRMHLFDPSTGATFAPAYVS
jgi:multiple sugar transport system ATP-binding protein